ncbi:MAG TPA: hypothetical protein VF304_14410 [Casimicrobiaceae bacterium]
MNASFAKMVSLGLASLGLAVAPPAANAGAQSPPSAPVTVVNTDANAVPVRAPSPLPVSGSVTISGVPSVNINNTPSVTQAGTWNVGIVGVPAVSQSGTWNVGITGTPSFSLVTPTTPIPVTLSTPARTPIQFSAPHIQIPDQFLEKFGTLYHNASSQTLVIEVLSMGVRSDAGAIGGASLSLTTVASGTSATHYPLQVQELPGNGRTGAGSVTTRLLVDPGTDISYTVIRGDNAGLGQIDITFSGYLTDNP